MKMKTYKKKRKSKSKEEYIIKKLINKCKVSKKDISIHIFENKGVKYKYYICANKKKLVNYFPTFSSLKPYFCINPFGELEHPSVVGNEN